MHLQQFIAQTLQEIIHGIKDAQKQTGHGIVIPRIAPQANTPENTHAGVSAYQPVEFEITVRAEEQTTATGEAGARLKVITANIGGQAQASSQTADGHAATLKFKIPVRFPDNEKTINQ